MEEAPKPTFQDELEWCISQLETGLLRLNPTPKQAAEETHHILGVLRSQKAPLVKKRQVMHQVFGDYRLKMEEERKRAAKLAMKSEKLQIQPGDILGTVSCKEQSSRPSAVSTSWFTPSDNSFQFGFVLSEKNSEEINGAMTETCSGDDIKEQPAGHSPSGMLGFSTGRLNSEFAFNFAIPHQSVASDPGSEAKAKADAEIDAPTTEAVVMLEKSTISKPDKSDVMDEEAGRDGRYLMQGVPKLEAAQEETKQAELTVTDDGLKKRKRKKKKKPLLSETVDSGSINDVGKSHGEVMTEHPETCQSDDQMKKEVDWCIEQLELGLKTQKSTSKQMGEAFRAIKILRSEKAVLAKKRQLMRTMFGDYRAKMAEERRKQLKLMQAASKAAHIAEVTEDAHRNRSRVFWKSAERMRRDKSPGDSFLHPPTSSALAGTANSSSFRLLLSPVSPLYPWLQLCTA
ncbi:uncharacterized protein LOC121914293 isoform X3 [Sceloporus undulatus]|uniref:uncharacterized protein LOC121914293 isoform X3 n=1 Tax=Sceloporus undulatus TaxID=8520 RepID=UPI001C4C03D6|nr:uncharacterized protein LOC121914293 isoform X3 [Sceloporus undulatus]